MSEIAIYDTEGTRAYPTTGPVDEETASLVDDLATLPPWPIAWYDTEVDRLLQRMTAVRQREGHSTRPNTFYIAIEPARVGDGGLQPPAERIATLFSANWERPAAHDEPETDPEVVLATWRNPVDGGAVPQGVVQLLEEDTRLEWRVPDLQSGYQILGGIARLDVDTTVVMTTDADSVDAAGVVIELADIETIDPAPDTASAIESVAREIYQNRADEITANVETALDRLEKRAREGPPSTTLGAVIVTGLLWRSFDDGAVLEDLLTGDSSALVPAEPTLRKRIEDFNQLQRESVIDLASEVASHIEVSGEPNHVVDFDLSTAETALETRTLQSHLAAIEAYVDQVPDGNDEHERVVALQNLTTIRNEWLDDIDDSGFQLAAFPGIRRFTGAIPRPSPDAAVAAVEDGIAKIRDDILTEAYSDLDEAIGEFVDEWASFFDSDRGTIRTEFLAQSSIFSRRDLASVLIGSRKWALTLGGIIIVLVAAVLAGALLLR